MEDNAAVDYMEIVRQGIVAYLVVLPDSPKFTIVGASQVYLDKVMRKLSDIINRGVLEAFPSTPEQEKGLFDSFNNVVLTGERYDAAIFKYAITAPDGKYETRYWSLVYFPVFVLQTKELQHIVQVVEDITELVNLRGIQSEQLDTISKMESEVLVRAQQIKEASEKLAETNKQLLLARDEAIKANELKTMFIANVSHELRTPLSAILGYAELLASSNLDPEQLANIQLLQQATDIQLSIVNDLLDIGKIEAGKMETLSVSLRLVDLLQQTINGFKAAANKKSIQLSLTTENLPTCIFGDRRFISQVLSNLLNNAIKFTPEHGSVNLTVTAQPTTTNTLTFQVTDTGIGISPDKQARLFTPFYQVDSGDTRKYGGSGLGLSICKQLVEIMHGTINFTSEPNHGSTFYFTIPLVISTESPQPEPTTPPVITPEMKYKLILVVDDNDLIRNLVSKQLRKLGITNVKLCINGEQAVQFYKTGKPNLILMDIQMPIMDGYTATREIRKIEKDTLHPTPIIAMTASIMHSEKQKCTSAGMNDILGKPFTMTQLVKILYDNLTD